MRLPREVRSRPRAGNVYDTELSGQDNFALRGSLRMVFNTRLPNLEKTFNKASGNEKKRGILANGVM